MITRKHKILHDTENSLHDTKIRILLFRKRWKNVTKYFSLIENGVYILGTGRRIKSV